MVRHAMVGCMVNSSASFVALIGPNTACCTGWLRFRYHDLWRNQTSTVVFVLAFLHWLDTGGLLTHTETEALLNCKYCSQKAKFDPVISLLQLDFITLISVEEY